MAVDFTKPDATADRAQNLTDTKETMVALAKMLDGMTPTGVANGMIRWNTSANRFEKYNGSWAALSSAYAINVTTFNGQAASYYTNIPARLGYTPANKAGDTMTGFLTLNAAPTSNLHAATKKYVDDGLATKQGALGYTPVNRAGDTMQGRLTTMSTTGGLANPDGGRDCLEIRADEGGNAAYLAFHRPNAMGVYFGIDTDNQLKLGGWSMGATAKVVAFEEGYGSGWARIPGSGGLMVQYGKTANMGTGYTWIAFPTTFPNACFGVLTSYDRSSPAGDYRAYYGATQSGANIATDSNSTFWLAVGY